SPAKGFNAAGEAAAAAAAVKKASIPILLPFRPVSNPRRGRLSNRWIAPQPGRELPPAGMLRPVGGRTAEDRVPHLASRAALDEQPRHVCMAVPRRLV